MGRALLIAAALCAATACARRADPPAGLGMAGHASLTCAACHGTGLQVTAANARVRDETCTSAGCHGDGGPVDVQLAQVRFRHRQHGATGPIKAPCAGCHVHPGDSQDKTLASRGEACTLCHADQLTGRRSSDCRACHKDPVQVPVSSQGVPIPHSSLPVAETGCLRCHYDVSPPRTTVSTSRCGKCHEAGQARQGVGEDLHPAHGGVACTGCHEGVTHRVVSMSSAVTLDCRDCHGSAHGVQLASLGNPSATCNGCHATTHQAQQRLVLGQVAGMPPEPSMKFVAGMMCRSCHTTNGRAAGGTGSATLPGAATGLRGQASACAGCHRPEYTKVLSWWIEGTRERGVAVAAYMRTADAALGSSAPDSAHRLLASAREALAVVARAGGQHNLDLSDAIFRESVTRVRSAYRLAGRSAPPPPALGSEPHVGFCSYCHYSTHEPWDFNRMPAEFHRQVMDTARVLAAETPAR